jgi:DNA processing protein
MDESRYYHAIAIATHSGYAMLKKFRAGAESWEAAYWALKESGATFSDPLAILPDADEAYGKMERLGIRLVLRYQEEFPESLRHIPYPPFGLYFRGAALLQGGAAAVPSSAIAVVGTRRASADGKKTARQFARELARAGFMIASGLAFGIDAAAHEGALDAGGTTVAVLAGGLDGVYPNSHEPLARRILESGGTLVSEYPPGEAPLAYRFIERNRIMSGISRGVLIVEAPESSGALATARYAVEQDRDVFVVPGAVGAANFKGSHALIRQGAELVTTPDDILDAYGIDKTKSPAFRGGGSSPEETLILHALGEMSYTADVDKLVALTKLEPRIVNKALSFLLIRGIIKETEGGYTI